MAQKSMPLMVVAGKFYTGIIIYSNNLLENIDEKKEKKDKKDKKKSKSKKDKKDKDSKTGSSKDSNKSRSDSSRSSKRSQKKNLPKSKTKGHNESDVEEESHV